MARFPLPIRGQGEGSPDNMAADLTSGHMNNVRVMDTLRKQIRLGQRPALDKAFDEQVGGAQTPLAFLVIINVVD